MPEPRVLFVSKPIVPPWNDGSKNLVRDVASHVKRARPTVLTLPGAAPIGERVTHEAVYREAGGFSPALVSNARVLQRLVTGDPLDIWHFVFAPNPASSSMARVAITSRRLRGWRGAVVQTVASAPRRFELARALLFGDVVVTLSEWTRARLLGAGVPGRKLRVIPPCAAAPRAVSDEERARVRRELDLGDGPVVLYPGDYEVSQGAETVARAAPEILRAVPEATIVFACRPKTPRAAAARAEIEQDLKSLGPRVRHVGELAELAPLLSLASVVVFPVDDLYGKVDLPLVLLEALAVGIPLVVARGGPLESITSARLTEPGDEAELAREALRFLRGEGTREAVQAGKTLYQERFRPEVVAARHDELYAELTR